MGFCVTVSALALISLPSFGSFDQLGTKPFTGLASVIIGVTETILQPMHIAAPQIANGDSVT